MGEEGEEEVEEPYSSLGTGKALSSLRSFASSSLVQEMMKSVN